MGKKLIIKGADFSENGFHYTVEEIDKSELYYKDNTQVTLQNWSSAASVSSSGNYLTHRNDSDDVYCSTYKYCCLAGGYDATNNKAVKIALPANAEKVSVSTINNLSPTMVGGHLTSGVLMAFLDSNEKIVGGFSSATNQRDVGTAKLTAVGITFQSLEMNVPEGATHVVACYKDAANPLDDSSKFELKITCVETE